jgi:hypothetical protein
MKSVVVCGVARGGTSMAAGLVAQLGVHIATSTPTERQLKFNLKGMFEHSDFWLLNKMGKGLSAIPKKAEIEKNKREYGAQIKELFKKHAGNHEYWGFKNLSQKALDVYLPLLENPHIVLISRSLTDNARAYQAFVREQHKESNMTMVEALNVVTHSAKTIHQAIGRNHAYPCHMLTYESVRLHPRHEARRLARFLGIKITDEIISRVDNFIDPKMRTWRDNLEKNEAVYAKPT